MALRIDIVTGLKRLLRSHGMTYLDLAQRIGVSEAAVKRMFSLETIRLERLEQICEVLGIGLQELATESRRGHPPMSQLDAKVEQQIVDNPALMLALYLTLNRWTQADVLARYRFTKAEWSRLLARLDRLGIIELLPENRYRLRTARNFRWTRGGPMEAFLLERLPGEFLDRPFGAENECLVLLNGMVSPESAEKIARRLNEAAEAFDGLLLQDAALPVSERIGISIVLAERPWSALRLFDPWRRSPADASPTRPPMPGP